jgi:hypothetical protein
VTLRDVRLPGGGYRRRSIVQMVGNLAEKPGPTLGILPALLAKEGLGKDWRGKQTGEGNRQGHHRWVRTRPDPGSLVGPPGSFYSSLLRMRAGPRHQPSAAMRRQLCWRTLMLSARPSCMHGLQLEGHWRSKPMDMLILPRLWEGVESGPEGWLLSVPSGLRRAVCSLPSGLR